jgi:hypothetical protein
MNDLPDPVMVSAHFSRREFHCRCGGVRKGCEGVRVLPELVAGLEKLRALAYPNGLILASSYRCPGHNLAVGGASYSQHQYGAAADVPLAALLDDVIALRCFAGIGWQKVGRLGRRRKMVRHVDVRSVSGRNPTGGSNARPTLWQYP